MVIDSIKLHTVGLTLRDPFVTATSTQTTRTLLLVAVASGDTVGWGECSADGSPYCRGEDADTARAALSRVAQSYIGSPIDEPSSATDLVDSPMAAAALEAARWDLFAKAEKVPLAIALGGTLRPVASRAVLGRSHDLLKQADHALAQGYASVKIKLTTGDDLDDLRAIRDHHRNLRIAVDLNGSASHREPPSGFWEQLDDLRLDFIEQPYDPSDAGDCGRLLQQLQTSLCLDESVRSSDQASRAAAGGFLVNLKAAKFGGPAAARRILGDLPEGTGWWGGMLETGIGRAHSLALATLPGSVLPTDVAASNRYYERDVAEPFRLSDGSLTPTGRPGIGVDVDQATIAALNTQPPAHFP